MFHTGQGTILIVFQIRFKIVTHQYSTQFRESNFSEKSFRSSHQRCSVRKGVLKFWHRCFPVNLAKIFKSTSFYRIPPDDWFWSFNFNQTKYSVSARGSSLWNKVLRSEEKHILSEYFFKIKLNRDIFFYKLKLTSSNSFCPTNSTDIIY